MVDGCTVRRVHGPVARSAVGAAEFGRVEPLADADRDVEQIRIGKGIAAQMNEEEWGSRHEILRVYTFTGSHSQS